MLKDKNLYSAGHHLVPKSTDRCQLCKSFTSILEVFTLGYHTSWAVRSYITSKSLQKPRVVVKTKRYEGCVGHESQWGHEGEESQRSEHHC